MSSTQQSFDPTFEVRPLRRRAVDRRDRLTGIALPAALIAIAGAIVIAQEPNIGLLLAVLGLALVGLGMAHERHMPKADTIVLVGRSPMGAVIASTIGDRVYGKHPMTVRRASSPAEAAMIVRTSRVDEVIMTGPVSQLPAEMVDSRGCQPAVVYGPEKLESLLGRVPMELAVQDKWLARIQGARSLTPGYAVTKRFMDLAFAIGLGLLLLPLFPLIALAIKLDSHGSVLYSQQRVGIGGKLFRIYKFRTMRHDAERHGAVWAQERDPRITRVGRFMRLTRFDELPQIWNVLRGDMAVVGPRPERPEFTETLSREIPGYELRHTVKPGLTGWAQVCYRYTSSIRDTKAKVEYDLYYVKHLSLGFDIRILFRTVKVVIGMQGQ